MLLNLSLLKLSGILLVVFAIYMFLEEQLDLASHRRRPGGKSSGNQSRFLSSISSFSLEDQLIEALLMISSSLKAGRNLDQAFELVAISTPPPICTEFQTLVQERRLGTSMVEALGNLARRVNSPDLRLAVNATIFQQETGGNLEDLYRQIVVTVTERKKIMGRIIAGTAHARLSGTLVGSIPILMALLIGAFHPGYLEPMINNPYGLTVLALAFLLSLVGIMIIQRMTSGIMPDPEESMIVTNEYLAKGRYRWIIVKPILKIIATINRNVFGKMLDGYVDHARQTLDASGRTDELTPEEFVAFRALVAIVFTLVVATLLGLHQLGLIGLVIVVALLPVGFQVPQGLLGSKIRQRQHNIEYELPYTIDLLSLAIESGLDLVGGIQKIVDKSRSTDIIVEFQAFIGDIKVGKSLEEALSEMAERVQVLSFFSFVSSLIQAQRLGAEIGPTLRSQAEMMRYQRMILAEEKVNKLPVKLLVPLVFFVFPALTVLLIGPAIVQLLTTLPRMTAEAI